MFEGSEPGKWVAGAGLLALGIILILAGCVLGSTENFLYYSIALVGICLDAAIIDDQILKNLRIARRISKIS